MLLKYTFRSISKPQIICFCFFIPGTEGKALWVSIYGVDFADCGQSIPCRTLGFVLNHQAVSNDTIIIDNNNNSLPFIIHSCFPIMRNITLLGINGQPKISAQGPMKLTYLFEDSKSYKIKLITLRVENLILEDIGIISLTNILSDNYVSFQNCFFQNIVTSHNIIRIQSHSYTLHAGIVHFRQCIFSNNTALHYSRAILIIRTRGVFLKCIFKNNLSAGSGLILLVGGFSIIKNSNFEKNIVKGRHNSIGRGGAVFACCNSVAKILNCYFKANEAAFGGAIYTDGKKLYIQSSLFIENIAVNNNRKGRGMNKYALGGAVYAYIETITEIVSSSFKMNKAISCGGAIYYHCKNKLIIRSSLFEHNTAVGKYANEGKGGAVYLDTNSTIDILNSSFLSNTASNVGGAVYTYGGKLVIKTSVFECNTAAEKYDAAGGAVYSNINPIVDILNCSFLDNQAAHSGGAISTFGRKLVIKASVFERNTAVNKHGSKAFGGAIYAWNNVVVEISSSLFKWNEASYLGGSIVTSCAKLIVKTSLFEYNAAVNKKFRTAGGAVFAKNGSIIEISSSCFKGNVANLYGGAIYLTGISYLIKASNFEYNTIAHKSVDKNSFPGAQSKIVGGAVYAHLSCTGKILNCLFKKNKGGSGGAVFTKGKRLIIKSSAFENNIALSNNMLGGAAVAFTGSFTEVSNCLFQRNKVTYLGGAIYIKGKRLIITSSIFQYNTAINPNNSTTIQAKGGAVYAISNVEISNSLFFRNEASHTGGAIYVYSVSKSINASIEEKMFYCSIFNCSFRGNWARADGGAIHYAGGRLTLTSSSFQNNSAGWEGTNLGQGGAIGLRSKSINALIEENMLYCSIFNCSFLGNRARVSGGAIHYAGGRLTLTASSFQNNSAGWEGTNLGQGGAVSLFSACVKNSVIISDCSFRNNRAYLRGGALSNIGRGFLLINASIFQMNLAPAQRGEGGAIFIKNLFVLNTLNVNIFSCIFEGNKAIFRGGAIMTAVTRLHIRNSSFQSSSFPHSQSYYGGDLIYSQSNTILQNVFLFDADSYNIENSLIFHHHYFIFKLKGVQTALISTSLFDVWQVHMKCLSGKTIVVSTNFLKDPNNFTFLSVSCSACPQNFYSLYAGHLDTQSHFIHKVNVKCHHCPLGGVCEKGKIRAANNFWGYISGKEVRFVSCPYGYCCFKEECINYSSCHKGRTGILCGQCEKGLTQNLVTPDCLIYEECHHPWYWLVAIIYGILYAIVFMYFHEITTALKVLLIPKLIRELSGMPFKISEIHKHILQYIKSKFNGSQAQHREMQHLTNDVSIREGRSNESFEQIDYIVVAEDEETQTNLAPNKCSDENFCPGLLKIVIFFYQTNVLFKVYTGSKSQGLVHKVEEVVSTLFNLRVDGIFAQDLSWCPFRSLQSISKVLLKCSFIGYLFFLIFFMFIVFRTGMLLKIIVRDADHSRLLCCTLRLTLISYAGITVTCFSLLSCVQIDHLGKVLFIDGSISCYSWWQIFMICFMCCWIVPFPVTIYTSSQSLSENILTTKQFFLCLLFPLPAICHRLYNRRNNARKDVEHEKVMNQDTQDILDITDGPFRKLNDCDNEKSYRLHWESILIGRRLVLIFIKTFVINTFFRLSLMMFCTVFFLVHHIYMKPFSSNLLNNIETVSLLMLNAVCFLNLIPAYDYNYPLYSYDHTDVIEILQTIESRMNVAFPFLAGVVVAFLIFIRIVQFMFLLCGCFVRLIRFCVKHKLS